MLRQVQPGKDCKMRSVHRRIDQRRLLCCTKCRRLESTSAGYHASHAHAIDGALPNVLADLLSVEEAAVRFPLEAGDPSGLFLFPCLSCPSVRLAVNCCHSHETITREIGLFTHESMAKSWLIQIITPVSSDANGYPCVCYCR